jgi:hypothetical protein
VKNDNYTFNADAVREPYNANTVKTFNSSRVAGKYPIWNAKSPKIGGISLWLPDCTMSAQDTQRKTDRLLERIVLASSNQNDIVSISFVDQGQRPLLSRHGRRIMPAATFRALHITRGLPTDLSAFT